MTKRALLLGVFYRVGQAGLGEAFEAELAGVAAAAGSARFGGVVTAMGQCIIDADSGTGLDDLCFGHLDDGRVDGIAAPALDRGGGGEVGHGFKRGDIVGAAIGIAAVVGSIDADVDIPGPQHLGPGQCIAEEDRIPRGDIGDGDLGSHVGAVLGDSDGGIGQGRAAEGRQIHLDDAVFGHTHRGGYPAGTGNLMRMPLAVAKGHGIGVKFIVFRDRQRGSRVQPPAEKNNRTLFLSFHSYLRVPGQQPRRLPELIFGPFHRAVHTAALLLFESLQKNLISLIL